MTNPDPKRAALLLCLAIAACSPGAKFLATDPPSGTLLPNQIALVDDGTCPAGQIKQVTGGSNRVYGTDIAKAGTARKTACIARPQ